jgi:hypothetical protein
MLVNCGSSRGFEIGAPCRRFEAIHVFVSIVSGLRVWLGQTWSVVVRLPFLSAVQGVTLIDMSM